MYAHIHPDIIKTIKEVSVASQNGAQITWEKLPKELRWSWTDSKTFEKWYVRLSCVRRLSPRQDPTHQVVIDFVTNNIDAVEAERKINSLNRMKVFW
jgi:hypothetical protein